MEKNKKADRELLILFTRFPVPGQVKTRLIPALGSYQAANLQRIMTRESISQALFLTERRETLVEVHFQGGDKESMRKVFRTPLPLKKQRGRNLGEKLICAFRDGLARAGKVAIVGTDCPRLKAESLDEALTRLKNFDVVVGPAIDGGFYLVGMSGPHEEILENIDWGKESAFSQLIDNTIKKSLSLNIMQYLRDIDEPVDLPALNLQIKKELNDIQPFDFSNNTNFK